MTLPHFLLQALRAIPQVFRVSPRHFVIEYAFTFLDAVMLVVTTVWLQKFFDQVVALAAGRVPFSSVLWYLCVFAVIKVLDEAVDGVANFYGEFYAGKSGQKMTELLNQKAARLPAAGFEDPDVLDRISQAYRGAADVRKLVHVLMDILCLYIPYFGFMGAYLYRVQPLLPLILPLVFVPVLASHLLRSRYYTRLEDQSVALRRKEEHYKECLVSRTYLKETRALGASGFFLLLYDLTFKKIQQLKYRADLKSQGVETAAKAFSLAGYMSILVFLISLLIKGSISIGAFSAILAATMEMFAMMEEVFDSRLGELSVSAGRLEKYFSFFEMQEQKYGELRCGDRKDLVMKEVGFTYPGASTPALSRISLILRAGETVAVVGENGSGKTTLSKLLLGLYAPGEGEVLAGGIALKDIVKDDLYGNVSCVFQDFQRYQLTLGDNVRISAFSNEQDRSDKRVRSALAAADFHVDLKRLDRGLETLLSKEFDGTELSRGEWQRLSIARAYYRGHQLIVLDEPTAAIDPFEEDRIYQDFMELKKGHTAVIITHRLGAIKLAERVVVLRNGNIAGEGSHEELLAGLPYYRKLWESSSKYMS